MEINRNSNQQRSCLISVKFPFPPVTFPSDLCQTMTKRVCEHKAAPQVRYTARSSPDPLNDNRICGSSRTFHLGLGGEGYLLRLEHAIMEKCEHSSAESSLQTLDGTFPSAKALSPPAASMRPPERSPETKRRRYLRHKCRYRTIGSFLAATRKNSWYEDTDDDTVTFQNNPAKSGAII